MVQLKQGFVAAGFMLSPKGCYKHVPCTAITSIEQDRIIPKLLYKYYRSILLHFPKCYFLFLNGESFIFVYGL